METLGEVDVRDPPAGRLPGGFWAAVGVWLEKPQVANKRLCGARLEEARALSRPEAAAAPGGGGKGGPSRSCGSSALEAAWEALCRECRPQCRALGLLLDAAPGAPPQPEVEVLLRTLVPKGGCPAPACEMVVKGKGVSQ